MRKKHEFTWNVVYTEPQCEYIAAYWLQRIGLMTFIPEYRPKKRRAGTPGHVSLPVFPNYVFVGQGIAENRYREIEDARGVGSVLAINGVPCGVPQEMIDELREATRLKRFIEDERRGGVRYVKPGVTATQLKGYKLGEDVLVTNGPFVNWVGKVVRDGGRAEIAVMLKIFNRETLIRIERQSTIPLDGHRTNHSAIADVA